MFLVEQGASRTDGFSRVGFRRPTIIIIIIIIIIYFSVQNTRIVCSFFAYILPCLSIRVFFTLAYVKKRRFSCLAKA